MSYTESNVMLLPGAIPNAKGPLEAVMAERVRQVGMWGLQRQDFRTWHSILSEELGEFAKEVNRHTFTTHTGEQAIAMNAMYDELAQVAAVAVQIMEQIDAIRAGAPVPQGPQLDEKTTGRRDVPIFDDTHVPTPEQRAGVEQWYQGGPHQYPPQPGGA